ncbi:MAG: hypothetical protein ACXVWU_03530, partial [Nocardioides sp.]
MAHYQQVGTVPAKRHTQFRTDEGGLHHEELMGEEGFSSDSSLLYHRGVPSAIVDSQVWELPDLTTQANHPLKPRHLKLHTLFSDDPSVEKRGTSDGPSVEERGTSVSRPHPAACNPVEHRRLVLGNADVRISYVVAEQPSPLYRNAIGDECVYVQEGEGRVETVFGSLSFRTGDYVILPRATTHRWLPAGRVRLYAIEAAS